MQPGQSRSAASCRLRLQTFPVLFQPLKHGRDLHKLAKGGSLNKIPARSVSFTRSLWLKRLAHDGTIIT